MRGMGFHSPLASADLPPGHLRFTGAVLAKVYEQNLLNLCLNCKLSTLVCQVLIFVISYRQATIPQSASLTAPFTQGGLEASTTLKASLV